MTLRILTLGISILGFNRGINSYDYQYNKNKNLEQNQRYLYSGKFCYGLLGIIIYVNPLLLFITVPKEVYRLEVNLRGLEDEKKTDYYNKL